MTTHAALSIFIQVRYIKSKNFPGVSILLQSANRRSPRFPVIVHLMHITISPYHCAYNTTNPIQSLKALYLTLINIFSPFTI